MELGWQRKLLLICSQRELAAAVQGCGCVFTEYRIFMSMAVVESLWKETGDPPRGLRKVPPSAEWGDPRGLSKRDWTMGDHCCRRSVPEKPLCLPLVIHLAGTRDGTELKAFRNAFPLPRSVPMSPHSSMVAAQNVLGPACHPRRMESPANQSRGESVFV